MMSPDYRVSTPGRYEILYRWQTGEDVLQSPDRLVGRAPALDVGHVECLRTLHREDVADIIKVLAAAPADLLDDNVLGCRQPDVPIQHRDECDRFACELRSHKRIIEHFEQLHLVWWTVPGRPNMTTT